MTDKELAEEMLRVVAITTNKNILIEEIENVMCSCNSSQVYVWYYNLDLFYKGYYFFSTIGIVGKDIDNFCKDCTNYTIKLVEDITKQISRREKENLLKFDCKV